jgi:hypothetical protein
MAYDKVKPLKLESPDTGGTQEDMFPTSLDPQEDYIEVRGLVLDDASNKDETTVVDRNGDNMQFKDVNNPTPVTLTTLVAGGGGLTPTTHRALDQLVHEVSEDAFLEIVRVAGKTSSITYWTDSGKTLKIRDTVITRDGGGKVSQTVITQYDAAGAAITGETLTTTITRSGGKVASMTMVRS